MDFFSSMDDTILAHTFCVHMPVVSFPLPQSRGVARRVLWTRHVEDIYVSKKVVETFWDDESSLVGFSIALQGQERIVFGKNDSEPGITVQTAQLDENDWVTGFVLHIPEFALLEDEAFTAIKGITVSQI